MPRVWLSYDFGTAEWQMWDEYPEFASSEVAEVEMNASLYRQIRAAQKKFYKFQGILDKFFTEAQQDAEHVRRVR